MDFLDFSSYDWSTWSTFIQEKWYVLLIALIIVIIAVNVIKTIAKWGVILLIVFGVIMYSGYSLEDIKSISASVVSSGIEELKEIGTKVTEGIKEDAYKAMLDDGKNATYTENSDGTFSVKTDSIEVKGEKNKSEVSVSVKGAPAFKVEMTDVVKQFIEQAQKNGK